MADEPKHGAKVKPDPRTGSELEGGPATQTQEWPGTVDAMDPRPDHGEESYRGTGKLEGRKALITGGDSGIGRAVAIAFAREGADVCVGYHDEHEDARETMRWVHDAGSEGAAFDGDLGDPSHCRDLVEATVDAVGGLDLLVNNAAMHFETQDLRAISDEQLDRVFGTNILSFFRVTREALDHMPPGSTIINTGSVAGMDGHGSLMDYAATKGAVHVFTKSLAQNLADRGIQVNCVAPGPVWTPLIPATRDEEAVEGFGSSTFWGRPAQPAEIAPVFVFLASPESRFITGEILGISGRPQTTR